MMSDVVLDFSYDHSIEEVWEALTTSGYFREMDYA